MNDVFVVTLELDPASQKHFQNQRDQYFPPHRNIVPAHVTLFHAIPASLKSQIDVDLKEVTDSEQFEIDVTNLRFMGFGVMYELQSKHLINIHASLRERWLDQLTRQDQQRYQPHLVIQNKSTPESAKQTLITLKTNFEPYKVKAESILLWTYMGGPWRLESRFPFHH